MEDSKIKNGILFILGSGASVDSGLATYRGVNAVNGSIVDRTDDIYQHWAKNQWLIDKLDEIKDNSISDTYATIQAIVDYLGPDIKPTIMTQNIDGLIHQVKGANIVELHGTVKESICDYCNNIEGMKLKSDVKTCNECFKFLRPNIIRIGDNLKVDFKKIVKHQKYDLVLIIGTTLQFPYLRWIIGKAKMSGAKVIHINPDSSYGDGQKEVKWSNFSMTKYVIIERVRRNERWICETSANGLRRVLSELRGEEIEYTDEFNS